MKPFFLFLLVMLFLTGCGSTPDVTLPSITTAAPETTAEPTAPPREPTMAQPQPPSTLPPAAQPPDPLESLVASMTLEARVGQLFLARCPETGAAEDVSAYHLGGYILFGRDFKGQTPDSLKQTLQTYQDAAAIPLLIAVDEEGGTVCRVSSHSAFRASRFPSPRSLYDEGRMEPVTDAEAEKCALLSSLGINVNMAPVCDVTTDPQAFMYRRSLGQSPEVTAEFIRRTVAIMDEYRIGSVLKHFPGYGNNDDTHVGIATDQRPLEELEKIDLVPFRAGIDAGCGAVLVSHTIVSALDDANPASLSPAVHQYLRQKMGFEGVIVTDDLVMEAITDRYGADEAAVLAVLAGNDLLCSSEYQIQFQAVLEAVRTGRISEEALNQSVLRVLRWKQQLGLLDQVYVT